MAVTQKSIKILWSAAGGRCAFPDCWERLCNFEAVGLAPYTLGEMAHICGEKPGANRHDPNQTDTERDDYQNLILLCPTHHTLIDRAENKEIYTVGMLRAMKIAHEVRITERLDKDESLTELTLARNILPLLEENRQSWVHCGPSSNLARTEPNNDAAYAVWVSERLSVIVPNNRTIARLLLKHRGLFHANGQAIIAQFLMHTRSYEQWVEDIIPYSAVKRFPIGFDEFIRRIANDGA